MATVDGDAKDVYLRAPIFGSCADPGGVPSAQASARAPLQGFNSQSRSHLLFDLST